MYKTPMKRSKKPFMSLLASRLIKWDSKNGYQTANKQTTNDNMRPRR